MAPVQIHRPHALRISALALAAFSLASTVLPAAAQTIYREYDDGGIETLPGDDETFEAPLRRRPDPTDDDDDERFERDAPDDDDDDDLSDDRQGTLDFAKPRATEQRRAPAPPPSVNAKPDDKAWKPAL